MKEGSPSFARVVAISAVVFASISVAAILGFSVVRWRHLSVDKRSENFPTVNVNTESSKDLYFEVDDGGIKDVGKNTEQESLSELPENENVDEIGLKNLPEYTLPEFNINWYGEPKKFNDEGCSYFSIEGAVESEGGINSCFIVGETSIGGYVIDKAITEEGMDITRYLLRIIKMNDGSFVLLEKNSFSLDPIAGAYGVSSDGKLIEDGKIFRDSNTEIPGINVPKEFAIDAGKFVSDYPYIEGEPFFPFSSFDNAPKQSYRKIGTTDFGNLFFSSGKNKEYGSFSSVKYHLETLDGVFWTYDMSGDGIVSDDGTIIAEWIPKYESFSKVSSFKNSVYNGGCGRPIGSNRYFLGSGEDKMLKKVGTLADGSLLYQLNGPNNNFVSYLYKQEVPYSDNPEISQAEFAKHLTILLSSDKFGAGHKFYYSIDDPTLLSNAECGKPVIYLYPEKETTVSVKVGAEITKSEPEYGSGWRVLASPSGALRDENGRVWGSLFWEGRGNGVYPTITSGRIVSKFDIENELNEDMKLLGLNNVERSDFMNFWLPKISKINSPYIRITWLMTEDMNTLAPLSVSPRPDTVIRVFLDFEGQDEQYSNIVPQKLTAIPREGFTLVEWGGLLRTPGSR